MKTKNSTETVKKELNQAKDIIDQFVNSCSHSLKGPIASIEGLVMIADYCTNKDEIKQCLTMIKHCSSDMLEMIHKLEEYTINMQRELHLDEIEADQLVERVLEEYADEISQEQIAVTTKVFQSHKWIADEQCNYLILKNLISNAIQFNKSDEKTKKINVKVGIEADQINIVVSDNGIGISEPEKNKMFQPFHRSSAQSKGSGLGLFLVKGLIDKLKASIEVCSTGIMGTSVVLSMPNNLAL